MPDTMIQPSVTSPAVPVEIARAIGEVMAQIKSLPKGERNDHGNYNFTSIDDFLAAVGPLCSAAGLIIYQDEHSIDLIDRAGKAWVKATYSFRLGHTSGVVCERPMLRTVFQQITGPQTMGSSQSYSLKMFLRSLLMIPTGEKDDPDFQQTQDTPAAQQLQQAPQDVQESVRMNNRPTPPKTAQAIQRPPGEPHLYIEEGPSGPRVGAWVNSAKAALADRPAAWRRAWLELHLTELDEVRRLRPEWADKVASLAIAPDLPEPEGAA